MKIIVKVRDLPLELYQLEVLDRRLSRRHHLKEDIQQALKKEKKWEKR